MKYLWDGAQSTAACEWRIHHAGGQLKVAHSEGCQKRLLLALGEGWRLGILVCRADGQSISLLILHLGTPGVLGHSQPESAAGDRPS